MSTGEEEFRMVSTDGLRLFVRRWSVEKPKAALFLVHGLGEHSGRYENLGAALQARGFSVWAADHRGHGRSDGIRGDCRSIDDFVGDLDRLVEEAQHDAPQLPKVLIGHSLGGLIVLWYAAKGASQPAAICLSAPALRLAQPPPRMKVAMARGLMRIAPLVYVPNGVNPQFLSRDPQVVRSYQEDPWVYRSVTARCGVALTRAMAEAFSLAQRIKIPCLILQGGSDKICDPSAASEWAAQIRGSSVTLRRYESLYHEIFNEPEKEKVISDLCQWIEGIVKG